MKIVDLLLWSVPILIIPASYIAYKIIPLRKFRYSCYALALIIAFFLNLFRITFLNDTIDTLEVFAVNFIFAEFFWNFRRVAKGKVFAVLFVIALAGYGLGQWHWLSVGPLKANKLWKPDVASTYCKGTVEYNLKDKDLLNASHPSRLLTLSKRIGTLPLEKTIKTYPLPDGYYHTTLTYKWSATGQGVRLDIWQLKDRLWTMGEGF